MHLQSISNPWRLVDFITYKINTNYVTNQSFIVFLFYCFDIYLPCFKSDVHLLCIKNSFWDVTQCWVFLTNDSTCIGFNLDNSLADCIMGVWRCFFCAYVQITEFVLYHCQPHLQVRRWEVQKWFRCRYRKYKSGSSVFGLLAPATCFFFYSI